MRRSLATVALAAALPLACPALAAASPIDPRVPLADFLGIGHALLGGLSFTAGFFRDLFTALLGGIADMLIPDSWARKGPALLTWLVASPDFTVPAFSDLQRVSNISLWLGIAFLPTTLAVSLGLPQLGLVPANDTPGSIIGRTAAAACGVILWSSLWSQGAALCNTVSHAYLGDQIAASGMNAYMTLIAVGGALGGVPILGILIVLFAGALFLAALVMKVFVLLIGGLLFASGPLLLGVVPTQRGAHLARTWFTALLVTWMLPVLWGLVFVVSGTFIHRAPAIGVAIGGSGSIAATGGTLVAGCAAIVGPLLCISLTRAALGPLGHQFGTLTSVASPARLTQRFSSSAGGARASKQVGGLFGAARAMKTSSGRSPAAASAGMTYLMNARSSAHGAARHSHATGSWGGGTTGASTWGGGASGGHGDRARVGQPQEPALRRDHATSLAGRRGPVRSPGSTPGSRGAVRPGTEPASDNRTPSARMPGSGVRDAAAPAASASHPTDQGSEARREEQSSPPSASRRFGSSSAARPSSARTQDGRTLARRAVPQPPPPAPPSRPARAPRPSGGSGRPATPPPRAPRVRTEEI